MSLTEQINDLTASRDTIRTKMMSAGQAGSSDNLRTLANNLNIINSESIQNQLNDYTNILGVKNILPNVEHFSSPCTINGVTFTPNSDGSITVNGISTAAVAFHFIRMSTDKDRAFIKSIAGKKVILTGTNKINTGVRIQFWSTTTNVYADITGDGAEFTIPSDLTTTNDYNFAIYMNTGITADNVVIYPMLRLASDPDDTYIPYAMTNREITEKIKSQEVKEVKTSLDSTYVESCSSCRYVVKNGICFVYLNNIKFTSNLIGVTDGIILPYGVLPAGKIPASSILWNNAKTPILMGLMRDANENIAIGINGVTSDNQGNTWYAGSLSYPIL